MKSYLNTIVSTFKGYGDTSPKQQSIWDWLNNDEDRELIKKIQSTTDKKERDRLKGFVSQSSISCTFDGAREGKNIKIKSKTGLICIDVDMKDNTHISNYKDLKKILSTCPFVAYLSRSVSGRGLFLIIPIEYPEKHLEHFLALEKMFLSLNIKIDPACKDVTRLRSRSYDPVPYINDNAKTFTALVEVPKPKPRSSANFTHLDKEDTRGAVERCIKEILTRRIDITSTEELWTYRAFELISEFGESARDYFHDVSSIYEGYTPAETDKKFNSCLRRNQNKRTVASFFYACQEVGIQTKDSAPIILTPTGPSTSPVYKLPESKIEPLIEPKTNKKGFDIEFYVKWYETLPEVHPKIALKTCDDYIFDVKRFANGRLKYISSHKGYKGPNENKSWLYIAQLEELKSIINQFS